MDMRESLRRVGAELLIWSSRLLLPIAFVEHVWLSWAAAGHGLAAGVLTFIAPGGAELVWLALLAAGFAPGRVVLHGLAAAAVALAVLAGGMALLGRQQQSRSLHG